eukprot:gene12498-10736_t
MAPYRTTGAPQFVRRAHYMRLAPERTPHLAVVTNAGPRDPHDPLIDARNPQPAH